MKHLVNGGLSLAYELSFSDKVKLFFRGWIDSKTRSSYKIFRCSKHGLVECQVQGYGDRIWCPECDRER